MDDRFTIVQRIETQKLFLKGQAFPGGSNERIGRIWLRREIVVARLPTLLEQSLLSFLTKNLSTSLTKTKHSHDYD